MVVGIDDAVNFRLYMRRRPGSVTLRRRRLAARDGVA
jgi:hypothetical protein